MENDKLLKRFYQSAARYRTRTEFRRHKRSMARFGDKMGLMDSYVFPDGRGDGGKYYYIDFKMGVKKYKSLSEFRYNDAKLYKVAKKNGWLDDYEFENNETRIIHKTKYTEEIFREIASTYESRTDFCKENASLYEIARQKGWYQKFEFPDGYNNRDKERVIYAYVDEETLSVYVGLTMNIKQRHDAHKRKLHYNGEYDTVMQYFFDIGKELPEPIILEEHLNGEEAQRQEDFWRRYYEDEGYIVLNIAKTGVGSSSLGGYSSIYNKEVVDEEAKKYDSLHNFRVGSPGAYKFAFKEDWLKEYDWLFKKREPGQKWTYNTARAIAEKFTNVKEFEAFYHSAYQKSKEEGWLDTFDWIERRQWKHWTKEECIEESKKYWTFHEFHNGAHGAYLTADTNDWLKEFTWLKKSKKQYIACSGNQMEIMFD